LANFVYKKAKQGLFNGLINTLSNQYKLILTNENYTPNSSSNDEFVSSIPENARVATSSSISNITNINGIIDGDDIQMEVLGSFNAIVFAQSTSPIDNSRLVFYVDTAEELPFAYTGQNTVTINWSNEVNKILALI